MAEVSQALARLKRDPIADLPIAQEINQLLKEQNVTWRDRLLPPLVTLRLFLIQIAHGNCAIAAHFIVFWTVSDYVMGRDSCTAHMALEALMGLSLRRL